MSKENSKIKAIRSSTSAHIYVSPESPNAIFAVRIGEDFFRKFIYQKILSLLLKQLCPWLLLISEETKSKVNENPFIPKNSKPNGAG